MNLSIIIVVHMLYGYLYGAHVVGLTTVVFVVVVVEWRLYWHVLAIVNEGFHIFQITIGRKRAAMIVRVGSCWVVLFVGYSILGFHYYFTVTCWNTFDFLKSLKLRSRLTKWNNVSFALTWLCWGQHSRASWHWAKRIDHRCSLGACAIAFLCAFYWTTRSICPVRSARETPANRAQSNAVPPPSFSHAFLACVSRCRARTFAAHDETCYRMDRATTTS